MKKSLIITLVMVSLAVMAAQASSASVSIPLSSHVGSTVVAHFADGGSMFQEADLSALNAHKSLKESIKGSLQEMILRQAEVKGATGENSMKMVRGDEEEEDEEEGKDREDEEGEKEEGEGWDRQWDAPKLA
jgi:hypothetical protein